MRGSGFQPILNVRFSAADSGGDSTKKKAIPLGVRLMPCGAGFSENVSCVGPSVDHCGGPQPGQ
jgi:hypothetical protein